MITMKRLALAAGLAVCLAAAPVQAVTFKDATCDICKLSEGASVAACTVCNVMILFDFFGGW